VTDRGEVTCDDPLVDGMSLSIRLRQDFTVTSADRLLAATRRMYRDLNPGTSAGEAHAMVSCAADALFVILEHAGIIADAVDGRLAGYADDGLKAGGFRAQVVANEPQPLSSTREDCLRGGDVFALPPEESD